MFTRPAKLGGYVTVHRIPDGIREWRDRRRISIACAVLLAVAVLAVCVVFGPLWLTGSDRGGAPAQRLSAENAVRSTLLQGFVGLLALGGSLSAPG
jgi:hypothetical protein